MFPIRYADPIASAVDWDAAGRPPGTEMVPILTRNVVRPSFNRFTGRMHLYPMHVDFILVDGVESPMGDPVSGWADTDACINPAPWPAPELAPADAALLSLCYEVDPDLPESIRAAIDAYGREDTSSVAREAGYGEGLLRRVRIENALHTAYKEWCEELPARSGELLHKVGSHEIRRLSDGRTVYASTGWLYATETSPLRIAGRTATYITRVGTSAVLREFELPGKLYCNDGQDCPARNPPAVKWCPGHHVPWTDVGPPDFDARLRDLQARLDAARRAAESEPVMPAFSAERRSRDRKLPTQRLPSKLTIKWTRPGRSSPDTLWIYEVQKAFATALGYSQVGREHVSGSGSTRSSEWVLKGQVDVASLVPEATSVDAQRGELRVPKAMVGKVVGFGGSRIRQIETLTGRKWRVVAV